MYFKLLSDYKRKAFQGNFWFQLISGDEALCLFIIEDEGGATAFRILADKISTTS